MVGRMMLVLALLLLAGCGSMIRERVSLAETCQDALDNAKRQPSEAEVRALLKARLGMVAFCNTESTLLLQCSYEGVARRISPPDQFKTLQKAYNSFKDATTTLSNTLASEPGTLKAKFKEARDARCKDPTTRHTCIGTETAQTLDMLRSLIQKDLTEVYQAQSHLRKTIEYEARSLPADIVRELMVWDANVKGHLLAFERVLGSDMRALIVDAGRNELMRYAARRSLDSLHRALRPADAALMKADEKVYGAISLARVGLGDTVQDAVNSGYVSAVDQLKIRLDNNLQTKGRKEHLAQDFQLALQRAACENISGGVEYRILTELVDTMFIMKAGEEVGARHPIATQSASEAHPPALSPPSPPPAAETGMTMQAYLVHEWAAREVLLTRQLSVAPKDVAHDGKRLAPEVAPVDEALVAVLAESAAATSIDDQLRADPALFVAMASDNAIRPSLAGAQQSVIQMTAILSNIVNVSNVNTFAPTNNVAPVVNVYTGESTPVASLCAEGKLPPDIASCVADGSGYVLRLKKFYESGACDSPDVHSGMESLGSALRKHAASTGQTFHADISGYASWRPGERVRCATLRKPAIDECTYWNSVREDIEIGSCTRARRGGDANTRLSAMRASHAARALESAADGSVLVRSMAARGTRGARKVNGNDDIDMDRSIVVRLWPASRQ